MVVAVSRDGDHRFSKPQTQEILLLAGWGVYDDAHAGTTVQHRSRIATDPTQPNLRQVHLIHAELFAFVGVGLPGFRRLLGEGGGGFNARMSRVPWNFSSGPMIVRLRSRSHHDVRHRHSARRHAAGGRLAALVGAGGR